MSLVDDYEEQSSSPCEEDNEGMYINSLFMCGLMVDNLIWLLKTSGLQDSEECAIMMEQTLAMQELVESALAIAEVSGETTFH